MNSPFVPLTTHLSEEQLKVVDFILEDESTVDQDLVTYFHQVVKDGVPEETIKSSTCQISLANFTVSKMEICRSWINKKDYFILCYKELTLYANLEAIRTRMIANNVKAEQVEKKRFDLDKKATS